MRSPSFDETPGVPCDEPAWMTWPAVRTMTSGCQTAGAILRPQTAWIHVGSGSAHGSLTFC